MDQIFKENPNLKECYGTSDGQAFYSQNSASLHAKALKDKTVSHHKRPIEIEEADELADMTVPELKAHAEKFGFTVTKTKKNEVLAEVRELIASITSLEEQPANTQTPK